MTTTDLPRQRLLLSAAVIGGASLPHWFVLPLWIPVALLAAIGWRLVAAERGWPLPRRGMRFALAALALAAVLLRFHTINGIEAGSALLIVMVGLKFVEARTHRDELVMMILAYFLVFASLLTHQHPLIGAYLLAFVFVTTVGLLQLGRRGALLSARRTAALAGGLLLKALPIMVILFVLFPRLPGPLWAVQADAAQGVSGLSDSMSPGDVIGLVLSNEVAFRVEFTGTAPPPDRLYWRGPVLTLFDGRTWSRAEGMPASAPPGAIEPLGEPVEYRMMLEPDAEGWAFALDVPTAWTGLRGLRLTADLQLVLPYRRRGGSRLEYTATSHVDYRAASPLSADQRTRLTRLPPGRHVQARALAADWNARGLAPEAIVAAGLEMIRSEPFYYTLNPAQLGEDPVDSFLFGTREGYCEHYASAFATLMRAAGIPARVVLGYHGGEPNAVGRYHIVRQAYAHAWTEVWLDRQGWTRVDPTAAIAPERIRDDAWTSSSGTRGRGALDLGWWRTAQHAWDALNIYWYGSVVGYGHDAQRRLLERLGFAGVRAATLFGVALVAATIMLALYGLARRLRWPRPGPDRAAALYASACRRLARRGVPPPARGEAPSAYAARAARQHPGAADAVAGLVAAYIAARYEPDADGIALAALATHVRGLRVPRLRPRAGALRASRETRSPASARE